MGKYLYIAYQYLIAIPLLIVLTLWTAVVTLIFFPCKRSKWLHGVQSFWSKCCCWLMFLPVKVEGTENLDPKQSYVFVANHQSMWDVFVIYGWLPQVFKWLMKAELKKIPFVGWACAAAGHIFVDRRSVRSGVASIKQVEKVLHGGVSTVIFPEGTRTQTGEVGTFKRGAFQVAMDLNLPVVPVALSGLYELMPKGKFFLTWTPLSMRIGTPIHLTDFPDEKEGIEAVRDAVIKLKVGN